MKHVAGPEKRGWRYPHTMCSMSRRGYFPHGVGGGGGGVFQGMVAAAALCCLVNADIVQYISSCTWHAYCLYVVM